MNQQGGLIQDAGQLRQHKNSSAGLCRADHPAEQKRDVRLPDLRERDRAEADGGVFHHAGRTAFQVFFLRQGGRYLRPVRTDKTLRQTGGTAGPVRHVRQRHSLPRYDLPRLSICGDWQGLPFTGYTTPQLCRGDQEIRRRSAREQGRILPDGAGHLPRQHEGV